MSISVCKWAPDVLEADVLGQAYRSLPGAQLWISGNERHLKARVNCVQAPSPKRGSLPDCPLHQDLNSDWQLGSSRPDLGPHNTWL